MGMVQGTLLVEDVNEIREKYGVSRQVARRALIENEKLEAQKDAVEDVDNLRKQELVRPTYYLGDVEFQMRAIEEQLGYLKMINEVVYNNAVSNAMRGCWNRVAKHYNHDNKYHGDGTSKFPVEQEEDSDEADD